MRRLWTLSIIIIASLAIATAGFANPPAHAPAHGVRAKHDAHSQPQTRDSGGFEFRFDSERGISIAVGLPGVYFEAGHFFRYHDGKWQVSVRSDGGWKAAKKNATPEAVRKAHAQHKASKIKHKKR
jgi:hypothetical protein